MAGPKRIQDVAHPNKTAPSGNSKSVIVTHHSRMQDPMVNQGSPESESTTITNTKKLDLKPLTAPILNPEVTDTGTETLHAPIEEADVEAVPEAPAKHVKLELKPLETRDFEPKEAEKEIATPDKQEESEESEEQAAKTKKDQSDKLNPAEVDQEALDAEQAKAEAALQKLVDSKQYFLPINTLEKRRSKQFITIGVLLSLIMIVAWVDIALDAGLITIDGLKPLTNFFST